MITQSWDEHGNSVVYFITDARVKPNMESRVLLYPSGVFSTIDEEYQTISGLLLPENYTSLKNTTDFPYYFNSNIQKSYSYYKHDFNIRYSDTNKIFKLAYMSLQRYDDISDVDINFEILEDYILTNVSKPKAEYLNRIDIYGNVVGPEFNIGYTSGVINPRLIVNIPYLYEINNYNYSSYNASIKPYYFSIYDSDLKGYVSSSGTYEGSNEHLIGYDNISSGTLFNLPYSNQDYTFKLYFNSINNTLGPGLTFTSSVVNNVNSNINSNIIGDFNKSYPYKISEFPVYKDIVSRKRYMVGIEDIYTGVKKYTKTGEFISNYYTVINPIYKFSMNVNEILPDIDGIADKYSMIKYYVEFQNHSWIRISPINRKKEYEEGVEIPKYIIFDKIGTSKNNTSIKEIHDYISVINFRIKIIINVSSITTDVTISPEVKSYNCNVVDKNYLY